MTDEARFAEHLDTAVGAAKEAAQLLDEKFDSAFDVWNKTPTDPVSEVDIKSERRIKAYIRDRFPDHAFYAEESGRTGSSEYRWIVDPLDGTVNFVNGFPHYCISIALAVEGDLAVGALYYPPSDELYTAVRNEGVQRNGDPIAVSEGSDLQDSLLLMGVSPTTASDPQFIGTFQRLIVDEQVQGIRRLGSGAADLSWVARGRVDGFFDKKTSPWDVAAGALLVEEAGGRVTDIHGDPIDFSVGERGVTILATNGAIHEDVLEVYENATVSFDAPG